MMKPSNSSSAWAKLVFIKLTICKEAILPDVKGFNQKFIHSRFDMVVLPLVIRKIKRILAKSACLYFFLEHRLQSVFFDH